MTDCIFTHFLWNSIHNFRLISKRGLENSKEVIYIRKIIQLIREDASIYSKCESTLAVSSKFTVDNIFCFAYSYLNKYDT